MGLFLSTAKLASPTEATMNQAQRCVGNKNQSYICESGHCCEEMQCCNYYELWWFWLMCALILILTLGCVFHHRRIKHRLHQQQRQHEINLIAYREACNYTSPPFYFRFIPSYLLPDYDDLPTHRLTPPPPYCNLNSLPPELVNSGQEETHCLSRQVTPAPVTSTALCSSPDIVVLENSRENQHREAGRDRETMLKQGMDHKEQERDMEVGEDEKDELMGRRRHFTGDSGIEVCLCSQRAESNTPKELEEVFGNESKNSSLVDYCNGCEARDDKSDEKAAEFGVSQTSPEASQSLCLYLGTINEQEGPQEYQS